MSIITDSLDYNAEPESEALDYHALNAELNLVGADGRIQFESDKEAARQYFRQHVNMNTVYFHTLKEKLDSLVEDGYYEKEVLDQYSEEFVKSLFQRAYGYKFRFETFLGALKYYTAYTLKTFDGKRYLERYEDRVSMTALYLARGNEQRAEEILDEIISGRFQPATPTFLNAGKAQRGELVSCFPAGSLVSTRNGRKAIETIQVGDEVLSHDGSYNKVTDTMSRIDSEGLITIKIAGNETLILTPEHPVLTTSEHAIEELAGKDGSSDNLRWVAARDIQKGDYIVATFPKEFNNIEKINVLDYLTPELFGVSQRSGKEWAFEEIDGLIYRKNLDKKQARKNDTPMNLTVKPIKSTIDMNYDFGRLLGYFIAEGHVIKDASRTTTGKGINFTFGSHEQSFIDDTISLVRGIFGLEAKTLVGRDGSTSVAVYSKMVAAVLLGVVGTGFNKKALSDTVLHANLDLQRGLLVGAYRGDGCTTSSGVTMSLVNPELVHQLRSVALRLGLLARYRTYINAAGNETANVDITGFPGNEWEFIQNVDKNIGGFIGANPLYSSVSKWIDGTPVYRVNETSFELGENEVYNLEVENTHTYTVAGMAVHNCFLLRVEDNMESIAKAISSALQLSKRGGGVALNLTNLREFGAPIKKIKNQGAGVVPVMKMLEDAFSYANQLGARQGAGAVYLNAHHPDIMEFLDTKRENADEKIRIKTLSMGIVVPDITFELARKNEDMYLFSPYDVERVYGVPFTEISVTEKYDEMVNDPRITKTKISARKFFSKVAEIQFESGYPYLMFEDTVNEVNPIDGRITMSNLCSEILQTSTASTFNADGSYDVIGKDISCNLGSLNVAKAFDSPNFSKTIEAAMRALTSVSDLSDISSVPSVAEGNRRSHAVGLGAMNLHGFFGRERIHYDSVEAVDFTNLYFYAVNYETIKASVKIAKETGERFDGFEKSAYATGEYFEKYIEKDWSVPETEKVKELFGRSTIELPTPNDWKKLKKAVQKYGMYHAYRQAIPPTGSISYINNSTASIHPITTAVEIRKEGKLGRVYYPAPHMTNDNLEYYKDAYEIGYEAIINVYAAATQHVDQGLSLTLFFKGESTTRDLNKAYIYAWRKGIKTLYYIRLRKSALKGTELQNSVGTALSAPKADETVSIKVSDIEKHGSIEAAAKAEGKELPQEAVLTLQQMLAQGNFSAMADEDGDECVSCSL